MPGHPRLGWATGGMGAAWLRFPGWRARSLAVPQLLMQPFHLPLRLIGPPPVMVRVLQSLGIPPGVVAAVVVILAVRLGSVHRRAIVHSHVHVVEQEKLDDFKIELF